MTDQVELAIIGAGPAGIEAAITASEAGIDVMLIDGNPLPGGQYYHQLPSPFMSGGQTPSQKEGAILLRLLKGSSVRRLMDTLVWGAFPVEEGEGYLLTLYGENAPMRVQAKSLIIGTGAYDAAFPFPGWTLPGVMTAGAAQILVKYQRISPGKRVLISGSGPLQWALAAQLIHAGVEVVAVLEATVPIWKGIPRAPALWGQWSRLWEGFNYLCTMLFARVPFQMGWAVIETRGKGEVQEAIIARLDGEWRPVPGSEQSLSVDTVITGYGFIPNNRLSRLLGCQNCIKPELGGSIPVRDDMLQTSLPDVYVVGDAAGIGGVELARLEGRVAAMAVAWRMGKLSDSNAKYEYARLRHSLARERRFARFLGKLFNPGTGFASLAKKETIICRCEEVTLGEIQEAVNQGARSVNEVKMLTRGGMGNCQGRVCEESIARAIIAASVKEEVTLDSVGAFTIRPPLHPLPVSVLAETAESEEA